MRHDRRLATLLILVAALMTAYATPAVAGNHGDTPGDDEADDEADDAPDNGDGDPPEDPEDDRGRSRAGVGHVSHVDGAFEGRFIDGELTGDGLANLSYDGTMLFDRITVTNLTITETRIDGARVRIEGETEDGDVGFRLHDTASAFARFEVDDGDLTFDLADGAEVVDAERGYQLTHDDVTARLWLEDGDLTVDNGTLRSAGEVEVKMLVSPSGGSAGDGNVHEEISEAAARGRVGAEVRMSRADGTLRSEVARFSNMSVLGSRSENGVVVLVSSENPRGRAVVLHLDRSVFANNGTGELVVRFDGEPAPQADDLQDVLDPNADEPPEYVIVHGAEQIQVLVGIPSFSPHTIEVASLPGTEVITGLSLTQVAMAALAAVATVAVAAGVAGKR